MEFRNREKKIPCLIASSDRDKPSRSSMHGGILSHQDPARADPLSGIRPGSWPICGRLSLVGTYSSYGSRLHDSIR